jgi:hypothetical protein
VRHEERGGQIRGDARVDARGEARCEAGFMTMLAKDA